MVLLELLYAFFTIGLFSFGGGYAIISLLRAEAVSRAWLTAEEFANVVAISQVTPGPIAVNMATFVGFRQAGVAGAFAATLGVCLPSFVLVTVVMRFVKKFDDSRAVKGAFFGIRPAVAGFIAAAVFNILLPEVWRGGAVDWKGLGIFAASFAAAYKFKVNIFLVILGAAILGIILYGVF